LEKEETHSKLKSLVHKFEANKYHCKFNFTGSTLMGGKSLLPIAFLDAEVIIGLQKA